MVGLTAATVLGLSFRTDAQTPEPLAQNRGTAQQPLAQAQPKSRAVKYQMTGSVRLEKTGEPVAGATIGVLTGDSSKEHRASEATAKSGKDGIYAMELSAGHFELWYLVPPAGYWSPSGNGRKPVVLTPTSPIARQDYVVRRGTRWIFRIVSGAIGGASSEMAFAFPTKGPKGNFRSVSIDKGLLCLTLPSEAGQVSTTIVEDLTGGSATTLSLEWDAEFRTDSIKSITRVEGAANQYRLADTTGKSASMSNTGGAEPIVEAGNLVVCVTLPKPDNKSQGILVGQVLEETGKPLEGAHVSLTYQSEQGSGMMSPDKKHQVITDAEGRYLIPAVGPLVSSEKSLSLGLVITRDGFGGIDTKTFRFEPPASGTQVVDPVRLSPGFSVNGVVLDVEGKPAAGVWVRPGGSYASRSQFTKTDDDGRFVVRDLPAGIASLAFTFGNNYLESNYWAERNPKQVEVRLNRLCRHGTMQARPRPPSRLPKRRRRLWKPGELPRPNPPSEFPRRNGKQARGPTERRAGFKITKARSFSWTFGASGVAHACMGCLSSTSSEQSTRNVASSFYPFIQPAMMFRPSVRCSAPKRSRSRSPWTALSRTLLLIRWA